VLQTKHRKNTLVGEWFSDFQNHWKWFFRLEDPYRDLYRKKVVNVQIRISVLIFESKNTVMTSRITLMTSKLQCFAKGLKSDSANSHYSLSGGTNHPWMSKIWSWNAKFLSFQQRGVCDECHNDELHYIGHWWNHHYSSRVTVLYLAANWAATYCPQSFQSFWSQRCWIPPFDTPLLWPFRVKKIHWPKNLDLVLLEREILNPIAVIFTAMTDVIA